MKEKKIQKNMFEYFKIELDVDIPSLDTSKVTDTSEMFNDIKLELNMEN